MGRRRVVARVDAACPSDTPRQMESAAQLAEALVESGDLLVLLNNMETFRSDHVRCCMAKAISRKAKTVFDCVLNSGSEVLRFFYSSGAPAYLVPGRIYF
jgi:hypothetical protein